MGNTGWTAFVVVEKAHSKYRNLSRTLPVMLFCFALVSPRQRAFVFGMSTGHDDSWLFVSPTASQDKFTEYVVHVSSITNISKQGKGRFSIHFGKKRFEFMAHSEGG